MDLTRQGLSTASFMVATWLLLCLMTPPDAYARKDPKNTCVFNLRQIEAAVSFWASDNRIPSTNEYALTELDLVQWFGANKLPQCPSGGILLPGKTIAHEPWCTVHGSASQVTAEGRLASMRAIASGWILWLFLGVTALPFLYNLEGGRKRWEIYVATFIPLFIGICAFHVANGISVTSQRELKVYQFPDLALILLGLVCAMRLVTCSYRGLRFAGLGYFGLFLGLGLLIS